MNVEEQDRARKLKVSSILFKCPSFWKSVYDLNVNNVNSVITLWAFMISLCSHVHVISECVCVFAVANRAFVN